MITAKDALQLCVKKQHQINQGILSEIYGYIEKNANLGNTHFDYGGDIPQFVFDVLVSNGYVVKKHIVSGGTFPEEGEVLYTRITWYVGMANDKS